MKIVFRVPFLLIGCVIGGHAVGAQNNSPFSANPESRGAQTAVMPRSAPQLTADTHAAVTPAPDTSLTGVNPTAIYKVAAGDVLYVTLANTSNAGGYFSLRQDGTIDFPLAGGSRAVQGMTIDEIERDLAAKVTIFP
ncbi:MAG TPA: polysaccharide biosynthesis/export family protein, partial [Pyrinomonadaceae bacterium]|nr:polysaccharide biosynthesis/export family protein [Pyrinomonadaceae bacterium]